MRLLNLLLEPFDLVLDLHDRVGSRRADRGG
jgi:hypothetical protein